MAALGKSVDVLASGGSTLTRSLRVRARSSSRLSSAAWRLSPKSDVVPIGLFAVVSRAIHSRCDLFIWAGSSFLDDAR